MDSPTLISAKVKENVREFRSKKVRLYVLRSPFPRRRPALTNPVTFQAHRRLVRPFTLGTIPISMSFLARNVASACGRIRFHPARLQSASRFSSVAASHDQKAPNSQPNSFFSKYSGWFPLVAIGGTVALSKELLILNEEILILFTFSTTVYGLYTQVGSFVSKTLDDRAARISNDLSQVLDQSISSNQQQIESAKNMLTIQEDVDAIFTQQQELMGRYLAAMPNSLKANINSQISSRLSMLAEKDSQILQTMQSHLADSAAAAVRKAMKSGDQKSLIMNAIQSLEGGDSVSKQDPVKKAFAAYFAAFNKKMKSQRGTEYKLTQEEKIQWRATLDDLIRRDPNLKDDDVEVPDTVKL